MRNLLHLALDQAVKNKLLKENPTEGVRLPKNVQREMRVLSREEQDRLIKAARQAPEPAAFGIVFDLFTGLRLGELCGLRWQNVDMEQGIFQVCEPRRFYRSVHQRQNSALDQDGPLPEDGLSSGRPFSGFEVLQRNSGFHSCRVSWL